MQRIAGLIDTGSKASMADSLSTMLESYRRHSSVELVQHTTCTDHIAFGVCATEPKEQRDAAGLCTTEGVTVALSGLFFNRSELAEALGGVAEDDAALLIELYLRFGLSEALAKCNGDFAFALFDERKSELILGRDRFGIRPLYYTVLAPESAGGVAFASQPGALLQLPGVPRGLNQTFVALFAASHYRTIDNSIEESPFAAIRQVPAGSFAKVTARHTVIHRWYSLNELPNFDASETQLAEQYRELLFRAVNRRLQTTARRAFTLSGGMDSSSVLSSAVTLSHAKQIAYSTVYDDLTYDESADIQPMLSSQVGEWHPVNIPTPDLFQTVSEMVAIHDEPVATATWLSHYLLCKRVAEDGISTVFGGLGGDELNAGEYEYFFFFFADLRANGREAVLDREIGYWVEYHDHPIVRKSKELVEASFNRIVDLTHPGCCRSDRARLERYSAALQPDFFRLERFTPVMDQPFHSYLKNRTYQDIFRETAPCCLRAQDRNGSAFGLQHVLPFFDHELVEFMFRIPETLKIRDGVTKYLLRQAMKNVLPEETRTRVKKTGWNAPAHQWFSEQRNLENLRDLIGSRSFRERGIYNVPEVERLVTEHQEIVRTQASRENHMMFLWQLINLELWLQNCVTPSQTRAA